MTASPILSPAGPARVASDLRSRRDHALALLLTHRGDPLAEIDRVLADDRHCVSAHCLAQAGHCPRVSNVFQTWRQLHCQRS